MTEGTETTQLSPLERGRALLPPSLGYFPWASPLWEHTPRLRRPVQADCEPVNPAPDCPARRLGRCGKPTGHHGEGTATDDKGNGQLETVRNPNSRWRYTPSDDITSLRSWVFSGYFDLKKKRQALHENQQEQEMKVAVPSDSGVGEAVRPTS